MTQNNDNLQCWSACWKATTSAVQKETDEHKVAASWNKRWGDRPKRHAQAPGDRERMEKSADETIGFLKDAGFTFRDSRILDIGCGPGTLAIPLAREGADVTALDISGTTLGQVREAAEKEGLAVQTQECSWWTADIDQLGSRKKYDLVIASRTPAICDAESIERMMACSKNLCYYSSFLTLGENRAQAEIRKIVAGDGAAPRDDMRRHFQAYTMVFPFMYLYFAGYLPMVRLNSRDEHPVSDPAEAAERAIRMHSRDGDLPDETKEKIRACFCNAPPGAESGASPAGCHGMMIWSVKGRQ